MSKTTGITWDYYLAAATFTVFIGLLIAGATLDAIYHRYFWVSLMFVQLSFIFAKRNKRSPSEESAFMLGEDKQGGKMRNLKDELAR